MSRKAFTKFEIQFWSFTIFLGIIIGFFIQKFGLSATPDSMQYMDAALSFQKFEVNVLPVWGFFYPLLLSIFSLTHLPAEVAGYLNGFAFALLTRYVGYFLISYTLLVLWFCRKKSNITTYISVLIFAYSPHAIWLIYNVKRNDTSYRKRLSSPYRLSSIMDPNSWSSR